MFAPGNCEKYGKLHEGDETWPLQEVPYSPRGSDVLTWGSEVGKNYSFQREIGSVFLFYLSMMCVS